MDTLKGRALQRGEWPDERGVGWGGGGGKGRPDAASFCPHLEQPLPSVFPSLDWTVLWPFLLRACPCSPPIKCSCQVAPWALVVETPAQPTARRGSSGVTLTAWGQVCSFAGRESLGAQGDE